ncbi:uncharacterized protein JCM15063_000713 [Sporobolomyces koalae]|uniref:uncharacterized protein n=1 Tax=Sporobolomyces koalae TaxID=500713 RepID=UPI00317A9A66
MSTTTASADPDPVPELSKAQIALIRSSPSHQRLRRLVYTTIGLSGFGFIITVPVIVYVGVLAGPIVREHRWLIFHLVMAACFAALWVVYCMTYHRHLALGAWVDQLKIDAGWISFAVVFSSSFLFYLSYKLHSGSNCVEDLRFVRLSPLVVGIMNLCLLGVQIYILVLLYRSPLVNTPLDEHGMPRPINPITGAVLPLGRDGKPILPPELRPQHLSNPSKKSGQSEADEKTDSAESDSEEEEKTLLDDKKTPLGMVRAEETELGRARRQRPSRAGYSLV